MRGGWDRPFIAPEHHATTIVAGDGRWVGAELTAENGRMLYIPPLCAHGYQTLDAGAEIYYLTSAVYAPAAVRGLRFDDPTVAIRWPLPPVAVSPQDAHWPFLAPQEQRSS